MSSSPSLVPSSSLDDQTIIRLAEEKIRVKTIALGLRVTEFFHDFDRLRSGYVTASQFKRFVSHSSVGLRKGPFSLSRCLDTNLRLQLSLDEERLLFGKYDLKGDGTICYREFCQVINRKYPETTLTPHPESLTNAAPPYLNSWRSTRHVGNEDESERLKEILTRIGTFCEERRIDVLTTMEQFDKHQMGEITESQFYRAFVGPKLNEGEMTLLRDKYSDPAKPGLINYLNFVHDLNAVRKGQGMDSPFDRTNAPQTNLFVGIEEKVSISFPLPLHLRRRCRPNIVRCRRFWIRSASPCTSTAFE